MEGVVHVFEVAPPETVVAGSTSHQQLFIVALTVGISSNCVLRIVL
jgi:hypothetical protein